MDPSAVLMVAQPQLVWPSLCIIGLCWLLIELSIRWKPNPKVSKWRDSNNPRQTIEPLQNFELQKVDQLRVRPFKSVYHLTMGIESITASELIEMDNNYVSRIDFRRETIEKHAETAIGALPGVKPALDELYQWLTSDYLPVRFPSVFRLDGKGDLRVEPLDITARCQPATEPHETLRMLGELLDNDFLILLPDPAGDSYRLEGYVCCCPSGFYLPARLGSKLRDIHSPVPGYKAKLEKSMDRFFDKIPVGKFVKRANWSITAHDTLFCPQGNHLKDGEVPEKEAIDIEKCRLRVERQTLHRLPKTGAVVFSFKTYLTPIAQIKEEGLGPDLAQAIDGLQQGSVPQIHHYKKAPVWGDAVKAFLIS